MSALNHASVCDPMQGSMDNEALRKLHGFFLLVSVLRTYLIIKVVADDHPVLYIAVCIDSVQHQG